MAQVAAELQPYASLRHYLGAELRAWRQLRGYSLARLGGEVHVSGALLGKIEKARRKPAHDLIARCDDVLDTGGTLRRLYDLACHGLSEPAGESGALPKPARASTFRAGQPVRPDWTVRTDGEVPGVIDIAAYRRRRIASVC